MPWEQDQIVEEKTEIDSTEIKIEVKQDPTNKYLDFVRLCFRESLAQILDTLAKKNGSSLENCTGQVAILQLCTNVRVVKDVEELVGDFNELRATEYPGLKKNKRRVLNKIMTILPVFANWNKTLTSFELKVTGTEFQTEKVLIDE